MGVFFFIEYDVLLEAYNNIRNRARNSIKKQLDCEPIYNKKFPKNKIRSWGDEATDFHDKEVPQVDCNNSLTVILPDFVLKKDENYYPSVFKKM